MSITIVFNSTFFGEHHEQELARSPGVQLLRSAWEFSQSLNADPWQVAVEIDALRGKGLMNFDLRWLLSRGFAQHATEVTRNRDDRRQFRDSSSLVLTNRDCFILTDAGYALATQAASFIPPNGNGSNGDGRATPIWKSDLHELWFRFVLVKRFTQPASSQESILAAFEEEGWPDAIFDPLSPQPEQDPKRRMHYTIQNLNRGQALIRFFVNGEMIRWEPANPKRLPHA